MRKNFNEMNIEEMVKLAESATLAYNEGIPIMEDSEFNKLLIEIEKVDPTNPILNEVGGMDVEELDDNDILLQSYKMYSIKPYYNEDEVLKIRVIPGKKYNVSMKENGHAIRCVYNNKIRQSVYTRGRSTKGKNITEYVKHIFPENIDELPNGICEIRGELTITYDNFLILNNRHNGRFVSPVNSIVYLYSEQVTEEDLKLLSFKAYSIIADHFEELNIETHTEMYKYLEKLNFEVPYNEEVALLDIDDLLDKIDEFSELKENYKTDTDGMVMVIDNLDEYYNAPTTGKYRTSAYALKIGAWSNEFYNSVIKEIVFSRGKSGRYTPKANIEPVDTRYGKTVSTVSLHNAQTILENDITVGDTIRFEYVGDINPKFIGKVSSGTGQIMQTQPIIETKKIFNNKPRQTQRKSNGSKKQYVNSNVDINKMADMYGIEI